MLSGIRHKDYIVYVEKESNENTNSYIQRLWFIVKNIGKSTYDELILYSWYFTNIKMNNLTYPSEIHENLEKFIN